MSEHDCNGPVAIVAAWKINPNDPSCGCYGWAHYRDGKPCRHTDVCVAHKLIALMETKPVCAV